MASKEKSEMKREGKSTTFTVRIDGIELPEEMQEEINEKIAGVVRSAIGKLDLEVR